VEKGKKRGGFIRTGTVDWGRGLVGTLVGTGGGKMQGQTKGEKQRVFLQGG